MSLLTLLGPSAFGAPGDAVAHVTGLQGVFVSGIVTAHGEVTEPLHVVVGRRTSVPFRPSFRQDAVANVRGVAGRFAAGQVRAVGDDVDREWAALQDTDALAWALAFAATRGER